MEKILILILSSVLLATTVFYHTSEKPLNFNDGVYVGIKCTSKHYYRYTSTEMTKNEFAEIIFACIQNETKKN